MAYRDDLNSDEVAQRLLNLAECFTPANDGASPDPLRRMARAFEQAADALCEHPGFVEAGAALAEAAETIEAIRALILAPRQWPPPSQARGP